MKALRVFFMCVVCFAAVCFAGRTHNQGMFGTGSFSATWVFTLPTARHLGLTGFYGGSKNNTGLGVMGSYEVGGKTVLGYKVRLQIVKVNPLLLSKCYFYILPEKRKMSKETPWKCVYKKKP